MNTLELLRLSIDLSQEVIDLGPIDDSSAGRPTACSDFDVSALCDHIVDTHVFLLSAAGGTADPGDGPLSQRHLKVGDAAVATWELRGSDGTVDLGGHELPAAFALSLHALEAFVHGWDLADALGRAFEPTADLVTAADDAAREVIADAMRSAEPGAPYGPALDAPPGASRLEALIAFTGRSPMS